MLPIIPKNCTMDDIELQKISAISKIDQVLSIFDKDRKVKTASVDQTALVNLFSNMLQCLNLQTGNDSIEELASRFSNNIPRTSGSDSFFAKQAIVDKNALNRKNEIKIVSRSIRDSHYQIDLSKDFIIRNGQDVFMVSCYARDAYLGRYLIKRNFFYTAGREKFADNAYDEIQTKIAAIKDRYYSDIIDVSTLFNQIKQTLDGVISEIKIEEDSIATTINR